MKVISVEQMQKLLTNNSAPPYKERNHAVLFAHLYWGLTTTESSLISILEIMNDKGQLYSVWTFPGCYSQSGEPRELYTDGIMITVLDRYLEWLISRGGANSSLNTYRGFDPESKLLVNNKCEPFAVSKRADGKAPVPRSMHSFLKRMIANTDLDGVTPADLKTANINQLYAKGVRLKDLMQVSGYKSKSTITRKIAHIEIKEALNEAFKYVRV